VQPDLREDAGKVRETPPRTAGASPNADGFAASAREWTRNLGVSAAAGVFLALIGALGTHEVGVVQRFWFWVPLMLAGAVVGHFVAQLVLRIPRAGANPWIFAAGLAVAVSIPITLLVWGWSAVTLGTEIPIARLHLLFGPVLTISAAMTAIMMLISQPGAVTHAPPAGAAPAAVRFMERLPAKLKGAVIYAVSAEDHYLRLHTSKGGDLILMRLADAISELEGLEGAQTHRSWWVAKDAVESARRDGERVTLMLKGGAEAPVSRPNIKPLREAGWF
jgi:hypothetical protein